MIRLLAIATIAATMLGTAACTPPAGAQPAAAVTAAAWPPGWVLPSHKLTPGAIRHDRLALICPHVSPVLEALRPTAAVKAQVYIEYRIYHHVYGQYEVDHLVPVELDGADTKANLWPEPGLHNAKDRLENRLHELVCAGQLSLAAAQRATVTDWRLAYVRWVGKP